MPVVLEFCAQACDSCMLKTQRPIHSLTLKNLPYLYIYGETSADLASDNKLLHSSQAKFQASHLSDVDSNLHGNLVIQGWQGVPWYSNLLAKQIG